jgi:DNA-binding CsgD family transcriptional regulator
MLDEAYRAVKRICHAGLDSVALRTSLAQRIQSVVPFEAYAFSTTDPDTGLLTHTVAHGVPDDMLRAYCSYFYPYETAIIAMDAVWREHPIFSLWESSRELERAMRPTGLRYDVHVALADRSGFWGDWCMMREQRTRTADVERRFLERIRPHITHALRTGALIDAAGESGHADNSRADNSHPDPCVLALDARARPVLRAGPVAAVLEDLADVGLHGTDSLPSSIINAAARVRSRDPVRTTDVPGESVLRVRGASGRWYVVRAMLAEPDAAGDAHAVVVVRPIAVREKAALLTRLYGLSEREREVTAAVARGESSKRIAARLQISPHTVKEHLDRACEKIGVRGRKALVARLFLDATAAPRKSPDLPRQSGEPESPVLLGTQCGS